MVIKNVIDECLLRLKIMPAINVDCNAQRTLAETSTLLRIINFIIKELASSYIDFKMIEQIVVGKGGVINVPQLSKQCNKIRNIKVNGAAVRYLSSSNSQVVIASGIEGQIAEVSYSYYPNEVEYDSVIDMPTVISDNMLICGTLTEYCMIDGRVDEALMYDAKYRDYIKNAISTSKRVGVVKARRW